MTELTPAAIEAIAARVAAAGDRCPHSVTDRDGNQGACDHPAVGWRWYQDVGHHEDLLDVACEAHENEGGNRMAGLIAEVARLRAALDEAEGEVQRLRIIDDGSASADGALRALREVAAIQARARAAEAQVAAVRALADALHASRFAKEEGTLRGPDNFYNGTIHAERALRAALAAPTAEGDDHDHAWTRCQPCAHDGEPCPCSGERCPHCPTAAPDENTSTEGDE